MGFTGVVPQTVCRILSGIDCNEVVTPDEERCPYGHELLPRDYEQQVAAPTAETGRRGHHLREQFDYETLESDDEVVIRLRTRPGNVYATRRAIEEFAAHHGVSEDEARGELFVLLQKGANEGTLFRRDTGYFRLRYEKFDAILDPTASVLVAYRTRHYERTPSEVVAGVRSRFGQNRRGASYLREGAILSPDELRSRVSTTDFEVSERLLRKVVRRTGRSIDEETATLREELRATQDDAQWSLSKDKQTYTLIIGARRFRLAADQALLLEAWTSTARSVT
jgi:hypothetical protein